MKTKIISLLTLLMLFVVQLTFAQQRTITGKVTDQNGIPLPGVSIVVKGTFRGVQSDFDGNYALEAGSGETLVYTYLGQREEERIVGTSDIINVQMAENVETLDEVIVVVPYGTVKKEALVGAATQIDAGDIEGRALTNILSAVEGASAGVLVATGSGQPGDGPEFRIRGIGSVNSSSEPLYVVDGVLYSGNFSSLNPNDIESITVLKDAASTSLYGSGAANGVIMITTKKGKAGKDRITLNVSEGISMRSIPEYDRVNAYQYYPLMWEAYRNSLSISGNIPEADANMIASGLFPRFGPGPNEGLQDYGGVAYQDISQILGYNPFNVPNDQIVGEDGRLNSTARLLYSEDLDWQDELVRAGSRRNIDLSYQGAGEKTDYFASLSYLKEDGYIINSDFERISGRLNINSNPVEWIKTGINIAGTTSVSNQAVNGAVSSTSFVNPFRTTRVVAPIYPVHLHDPATGAYILDSDGNRIYDIGENRAPGSVPGRHVIQETLLNVDRDKIFSLNARTYAEFQFLNYFTFTVNASLDKRYFNNEDFDNPIVGDGAPIGRAGRDASTTTGVTYNQLLNYAQSFDRHSIAILAGHESFEYEFNFLTGFRSELVVEGNTELINFVNTLDLESFSRTYTKESYFSRLNYDFDRKYFLSASVRTDGSSRFARDRRRGTFWSVGGAWRLDQENFISNAGWISLLKLRSSYGEVGNDSNLSHSVLSFYASQSLYSLGTNNAGEAGILISDPGGSDLQWETNIQTDVALEFGLLNNRITGTVEYYNRATDGLLFEVPASLSQGIDSRPQNIGSMFNRGIEVDISADIIRTKDFTWNIHANAATVKNEFTELPQEEIITGTKKLVVGGSIFDYWLRDWYGVDPADGAGLYYASDEAIAAGGSDLRDIGDATLTTNPSNAKFDFVGTALPDLYGSVSNTITYKGFQLNFLITYSIGGETYDTNHAALMHSGDYGTAFSTDILRRWQQPGDITDVPRLDALQTANFGAASDRFLVSSTNYVLRQVNLSYSLPQDIIETLGVDGLRVYTTGENLAFFTERKGLDPGQNFNGTTQNRFTPARIVALGVSLTF